MKPGSSQTRSGQELLDANRAFYDLLWSGARLVEPQRFNTWPLVQSLLSESDRRLEVAPGLRPRLPIEGTQFVDISVPALMKLRELGAQVILSRIGSLPFAGGAFDLVCALDIVEHVDDDDGALAELSRVTRPGGALVISAPLHPHLWTAFDDFVGHKRRYEPSCLNAKLASHQIVVERSAVYGMQPRSSRITDIGMWCLKHRRERALWWYNRLIMPLGLRFQKELQLEPGMIAADAVDEILLVCRRDARRHSRLGIQPGSSQQSGSTGLGVQYLSVAELPVNADAWWDGVLGLAYFGPRPFGRSLEQIPVAEVSSTPLADTHGVCEVWRAEGPMRSGRIGAVRYRANEQLLYGCISVSENPAEPGQPGNGPGPLELATARAYTDIFAALDSAGYPQLVRIWNYVSSINEDAADGERYWQFNRARQQSFLSRQRAIVDAVPAACALGTPAGSPLVIYFLASRAAMHAIENPRQVSAYNYPPKYGPSSPTFSRAALLTGAAGGTLLVSGTASIVGHESLHAGDVAAQTRESIANINVLITEANRLCGMEHHATDMLAYKVYVRNPADMPAIEDELRTAAGQRAAVTYLRADVCRRELLVEIEAVSPGPPAAP
jgi:SAM-dependent methyltransferase/enamine deaminase RidA (YjgF/YER057c/UK114 family)